MKERPILFSGPMVRAILEGRKTQTRRIVSLNCSGRAKAPGSARNWHMEDPNVVSACPYGQPGDRLWVKETWRTVSSYDGWKPCELPASAPVFYEADRAAWLPRARIRQSIFMRRWMSRLTLEITDIRAQRLQEISKADAIAEGIVESEVGRAASKALRTYKGEHVAPAVLQFADLWQSINGPQSWDANPYVWAITFRVIS